MLEKKSWKETGGHADTTEAAERALVLAARYAKCPSRMAAVVRSNCVLTQSDEAIACMTTAYCCVLALLVQGETLDPLLSDKLLELAKAGELPFHVVTDEDLQPPKHGDPERLRSEHFSSPDALPTPPISRGRRSTLTSGSTPHGRCRSSTVCPARSIINFQPLIILQVRFSNDFENAVLNAINGGGQNQARAILTGALVGAQVSLAGIPQRFLNGLENANELVRLAEALGQDAEREGQ